MRWFWMKLGHPVELLPHTSRCNYAGTFRKSKHFCDPQKAMWKLLLSKSLWTFSSCCGRKIARSKPIKAVSSMVFVNCWKQTHSERLWSAALSSLSQRHLASFLGAKFYWRYWGWEQNQILRRLLLNASWKILQPEYIVIYWSSCANWWVLNLG